ncbi:ribose-phosphate diphosphokinase [Alteromonas sp. a30]|uniref:ribose-phosphate diphosphokinase n=1 Tax=Alteromonas sp. a30 TaxID=2730917 RepID=UPI0022826B54|nr:ribose-phosphate diphosphokinase [Alteromonas sp. a30]MCY7296439.1 ribose-phosphate diphosphokinase [Alteromonas sp. a30]
MQGNSSNVMIFSPLEHPMLVLLSQHLGAEIGEVEHRRFPDKESYLKVCSDVKGKTCIILMDLVNPDVKYLPLIFLTNTLKEMGALSVGLVTPYLAYMRQDKRFNEGEAITSKIFAKALSDNMDWLVTVDPHLHRYHHLSEIYRIPTRVVHAASAIADWLTTESNLLLVGPDSESEQWVSEIADYAGHPYLIGQKVRSGDKQVHVEISGIEAHLDKKIFVIDDVISSGHTILECVKELRNKGAQDIGCITVHGLFADEADSMLVMCGLNELISCNTVPHASNVIDVSGLLAEAVKDCINSL